MAKVYSCTCCGSTVTCPYFFNGGVYGYTCIKKVNPSAKKIKDKGLQFHYDNIVNSVYGTNDGVLTRITLKGEPLDS